jgi:hypothetical protein
MSEANVTIITPKQARQIHTAIADAALGDLAERVEMMNQFEALGDQLQAAQMALDALAGVLDADQQQTAMAHLDEAKASVGTVYDAVRTGLETLLAKTSALLRTIDTILLSV